MIQASLTRTQLGIGLVTMKAFLAMRWLAVLIAAFIALAALTELRHRDFPPRPTSPMPAVNVP